MDPAGSEGRGPGANLPLDLQLCQHLEGGLSCPLLPCVCAVTAVSPCCSWSSQPTALTCLSCQSAGGCAGHTSKQLLAGRRSPRPAQLGFLSAHQAGNGQRWWEHPSPMAVLGCTLELAQPNSSSCLGCPSLISPVNQSCCVLQEQHQSLHLPGMQQAGPAPGISIAVSLKM